MTRPGKRATIADVARAAGVSRATASRVLNNSPLVSLATSDRVRAAMLEVGFSPSAAGRALATGRTDAIAVLLTESLDELFQDPTFGRLLEGISEALSGLMVLPLIVPAATDRERERALRHFQNRRADAIISISPYEGSEILHRIAREAVPVVLCGQLEGNPFEGLFSCVYADDIEGARKAGAYIVKSGHHRVAVINGPRSNPAAVDRLTGYEMALGPRFRKDLVVNTGWDEASGHAATLSLCAQDAQIDAILAGSDRLALGALAALNTLGKRVPEDVAVIGFDDHKLAGQADPPLTTIRQPMVTEGRIAVDMALELIAGGEPRTQVLPMDLIVRESA